MPRRDILWEGFEHYYQERPPVGWMNYRAATRLSVEEDAIFYYIYTTIPGINGHDMEIWVDGDYLFIEGQIRNPDGLLQQGMYVRHVPLREAIYPNQIDARFDPYGRVVIRLRKLLKQNRLNP